MRLRHCLMMLRLFTAIDLSSEAEARLAAISADIAGARWSSPPFHLTLTFLGDVDEADVSLLTDRFRQIGVPTLKVELGGLGVFPDLHMPRVLYARVLPHPLLMTLQSEIQEASEQLGFEAEDRPFTPHVTLARFRNVDLREVRNFMRSNDISLAFAVDRFRLYSSELTPQGARHRLLASFPDS